MRRVMLGFLLLTIAGAAMPLEAAVYKWTDANGTIAFRDTPPPEGRLAERVGSGAISVVPRVDVSAESEVTKDMPRSVDRFPTVELYTTSWCGYCRRAKAFLRENGVPFTEYDVERDAAAAERLRKLSRSGGVPVAVIGGRTVRGFDPNAYRKLLKLK